MNKLRALLWSSRPVSWINTAFPFVAGYLATQGLHTTWVFWVAAFYFLIPYNILIYTVNDVYDYESDMLNPRKGGVEGAILPKTLHPFLLRSVVACNIPFLVAIAFGVPLYSGLLLALIVFDALAYSIPLTRFKEKPVVDSISSSFHFVSPLLFALSLTTWHSSYLPIVGAFFLWGMASHAFGAVQDIVPDRKANIHSIATYFGAKKTARLCASLYGLAIILAATTGLPGVIVGIASLPYLAITLPYINLTDKKSATANRGWRHFMKINQFVGFVVTVLLILSLR